MIDNNIFLLTSAFLVGINRNELIVGTFLWIRTNFSDSIYALWFRSGLLDGLFKEEIFTN